jgi:hypothetical protein
MNLQTRFLATLLTGACVLGTGATPVRAASEMCPMGGTMIMAETDRDKALSWAKGRPRVEINDAGDGAGGWSVFTLSVADEGIAVLIEPGQVFFGVAGRGGETYPRDIERAFGAGFGKLRDAVSKTLSDLIAAGAVKIPTADVQPLAGLVGLGVLEKGAGGWSLTTRDCQAVDLPVSGL